jgi:hypothetical protein
MALRNACNLYHVPAREPVCRVLALCRIDGRKNNPQPRNKFKEVKMTKIGMMTAVAIALLPQAMRAQVDPPTLDNFSTGAGKASATSGTKTVTMTGSGIYGGSRSVSVVFDKGYRANAFGQPAQAQVRPEATGAATPSGLLVSEGYDVDAVIQLAYEGAASESLNLDMAPYNRFRVLTPA